MTKKAGRPPFKATAKQRRRVILGISSGMTTLQLSNDLGIPDSTLRKHFVNEIRTARTRVILENLERLDKAASKGNVSAARTLLKMTKPASEIEDEDDWRDVSPSSPTVIHSDFQDFH